MRCLKHITVALIVMPIILGASRSSNAESRAPKELSALTAAIQEAERMHTDIVYGAE